ncbi:unnamed protein product [Musa acuminata var. zebrina]
MIRPGKLPVGFRFHPTDEELVSHYLRGKNTGRIKPHDDVIPEIDVCKCEPWDLPGKSLIESDDPEWFFFAPRDRKYPNGLRSKRATEAGYWKATGKDRVIRSKATAAAAVAPIGMKKTLVFHRGRAPNGVRTNWIMHEYRTTEPEFEAGDQGGYVLYRLFKKPEENCSSSNIDEMEPGGFSPTTNKYSPDDTKYFPDDTQRETYATEEIGTPRNHGSPKSDVPEESESLADPVEKQPDASNKRLADMPDHSTNYSAHPDERCCYLALHDQEAEDGQKFDNLQDVLDQLCDPGCQPIDYDNFPNISSPMLPYTDYPFFGDVNNELFPVDNAEQDSLNDYLKAELNRERCSLIQSAASMQSSDWLCGTSNQSTNPAPQLNTENASLPPYHGTAGVYSVVPTSQSLQGLFNSMENTSNQETVAGDGNNFEEIGIEIRSRGLQLLPNPDDVSTTQGTAARRIHLQSSVANMPLPSFDGEFNISKCNHKNREAILKELQVLCSDSRKESDLEKHKMHNVGRGTNIGTRQAHHPPIANESAKMGTAARGIRLRRGCKVKLLFSTKHKSSSCESHKHMVAIMKAVVHAINVTAEVRKILGSTLLDKLDKLLVHDRAPPYSSDAYELSKPVLRKRTKPTIGHENTSKGFPAWPKPPRGHPVDRYVTWLILLVVLLPLCLGIILLVVLLPLCLGIQWSMIRLSI